MKNNWVATLNIINFKLIFQSVINWNFILLISALLLLISCAQSDDFEIIRAAPIIPKNPVIIYTDMDPDFISNNLGDFYNLDLNNDSVIDFKLSSGHLDDYGDYLSISSLNKFSGLIARGDGGWDVFAYALFPLYKGFKIYSPGREDYQYRYGYSYEAYFTIGDCTRGEMDCNWKDINNKYFGLRFYLNDEIHFGWVRMDVISLNQWTIKDYAYNATPNSPIFAGQKE